MFKSETATAVLSGKLSCEDALELYYRKSAELAELEAALIRKYPERAPSCKQCDNYLRDCRCG